MNAKPLSPIRFTGCDLTVLPAATVVAAKGKVCPALRPGRGGVASRGHRAPRVVRTTRGFGSGSIGSVRLAAGCRDSRYEQHKSVQAGGAGPGP